MMRFRFLWLLLVASCTDQAAVDALYTEIDKAVDGVAQGDCATFNEAREALSKAPDGVARAVIQKDKGLFELTQELQYVCKRLGPVREDRLATRELRYGLDRLQAMLEREAPPGVDPERRKRILDGLQSWLMKTAATFLANAEPKKLRVWCGSYARLLNLDLVPDEIIFRRECAENAMEKKRYAMAQAHLERLIEKASDPELKAWATQRLVESYEAEAAARADSPPLSPPRVVGKTSPGEPPQVQVINGTAMKLRLAMRGGETVLEDAPPCEGCDTSKGCDTSWPSIQISVNPDTYSVTARVAEGKNVQPFNGTWKLESGLKYRTCLVIRKRGW